MLIMNSYWLGGAYSEVNMPEEVHPEGSSSELQNVYIPCSRSNRANKFWSKDSTEMPIKVILKDTNKKSRVKQEMTVCFCFIKKLTEDPDL